MHIFWDLDNHMFVKSLTDGQRVTNLDLVLRDQVSITLHTVRPSTNAGVYFAEEDCPAGKAPLFGIKGTTQPKLAGGYLASQGIWTKIATGQYEAVVNLKTTQLIAEIGTETTVELKAGFTLVDIDGEHHDSTQFDVTVAYDVNIGGEAEAESVYVGNNSIVREELIDGLKVLILYNSEGVEYARFNPPGA